MGFFASLNPLDHLNPIDLVKDATKIVKDIVAIAMGPPDVPDIPLGQGRFGDMTAIFKQPMVVGAVDMLVNDLPACRAEFPLIPPVKELLDPINPEHIIAEGVADFTELSTAAIGSASSFINGKAAFRNFGLLGEWGGAAGLPDFLALASEDTFVGEEISEAVDVLTPIVSGILGEYLNFIPSIVSSLLTDSLSSFLDVGQISSIVDSAESLLDTSILSEIGGAIGAVSDVAEGVSDGSIIGTAIGGELMDSVSSQMGSLVSTAIDGLGVSIPSSVLDPVLDTLSSLINTAMSAFTKALSKIGNLSG